MASSPPVTPPPSRRPWFALPSGLSRRTLLLAAIAFGVGLVLFLLLIVGQGEDDGFFRAGDAPVGGRADQVFEPLPTPDAVGGEDAAPGRNTGDSAVSARQPEQVDSRGFPLPDETAGAEPIVPAAPVAPPEPVAAARPDASAKPVRSPPPEYPASAAQRGEAGTVLLQVQVDAQGRPAEVDVVQSSRSRALDREAVRAVRRWEFSPAIRNGQSVASKVLIPIEFHP
jgi:protein TonB